MWREIEFLASRYSQLPGSLLSLEFPDYNDYAEAALANQKHEMFSSMRVELLPFWLKNGKTMGVDFDTLCEKLDIQRQHFSKHSSFRKAKASKAIERAEAIKNSDSKRKAT
jgi:hypothetical protein